MKIAVVCVVAMVAVMFATEGDAVCCRTTKFTIKRKSYKLCNDCSDGTPYCSARGRCNVIGCNCDGGCREGFCFGDTRLRREVSERIEDAHDVIRAADVDGDGRMSVEEAHLHLGLPDHRVRRSLMELDTDNDDFLSAQEIDGNGSA